MLEDIKCILVVILVIRVVLTAHLMIALVMGDLVLSGAKNQTKIINCDLQRLRKSRNQGELKSGPNTLSDSLPSMPALIANGSGVLVINSLALSGRKFTFLTSTLPVWYTSYLRVVRHRADACRSRRDISRSTSSGTRKSSPWTLDLRAFKLFKLKYTPPPLFNY